MASGRDGSVTVRAGIYCRLSLAKFGDTTKVADQERICRSLAARLGWEVAEIYADNNRSAWQKNRKRPAWNQMLADVGTGKIGAIVVYHGDRLVRRPEDLTDLLRLAENKGVKLASPTGTHDLDNQRLELWIRAAFAEEESTRTSERKKSQYERWRMDGRVRSGGKGGRAFGFESDGITHIPAEADMIRRAAAAILRGQPVGAVAEELRLEGALSTAGKPLSHNTLRRLLLYPRMAGLMPMHDGVHHKAAWEPVLDRDTWEMVRAVLIANKANPRAGAGALHLLSGVAACGECGHALYAGLGGSKKAKGERRAQPGSLTYRCPQPGCHKVARNAALLDAYVTGAVVARLNHPLNPEPEFRLTDTAAAELAALTLRRTETEAVIANLADAPAQRIEVLNRALDSFDAKIEAIRAQLAADGGRRLRSAHAGITRKEFAALPLDVRRSLVQGTYRVIVLRASRRGPGFRPEDVVLAPV